MHHSGSIKEPSYNEQIQDFRFAEKIKSYSLDCFGHWAPKVETENLKPTTGHLEHKSQNLFHEKEITMSKYSSFLHRDKVKPLGLLERHFWSRNPNSWRTRPDPRRRQLQRPIRRNSKMCKSSRETRLQCLCHSGKNAKVAVLTLYLRYLWKYENVWLCFFGWFHFNVICEARIVAKICFKKLIDETEQMNENTFSTYPG